MLLFKVRSKELQDEGCVGGVAGSCASLDRSSCLPYFMRTVCQCTQVPCKGPIRCMVQKRMVGEREGSSPVWALLHMTVCGKRFPHTAPPSV